MNKIIKQNAKKINELHMHIENVLNKAIGDAIEVGRLLTETKASLKHGEFNKWISANLAFTDRTARNYMKLYDQRHKLEGARSISDAYKMLTEPKTETVSDLPGTSIMNISDNEMKLLAILEVMNPSETVTGFTRGEGKAFAFTIKKADEDMFNYSIRFINPSFAPEKQGAKPLKVDFGGFSARNSCRTYDAYTLFGYLRFCDHKLKYLSTENITWIYPGVKVPDYVFQDQHL